MADTVSIRFAKKVAKGDGCWEWQGRKDRKGYGSFDAFGGSVKAHRLSYELYVGEIPTGLVLDHLCRNHACVNPDHLEPVTHRENILRGDGMAAKRARQTHCLRAGHPLSGANLRLKPNGARVCRACNTIAQREYKARLRALRGESVGR